MHRKARRIILRLTNSVQGIYKPISTELYINVQTKQTFQSSKCYIGSTGVEVL